MADTAADAHCAPYSDGNYFLVPTQPFSEMSKMTPSGSLNFISKFAASLVSPSVKKNFPPADSMRSRAASRSSTWKPKWCAPAAVGFLYLSSARLLLADALQVEHVLVEGGRLLQVVHHHRDVPELRHYAWTLWVMGGFGNQDSPASSVKVNSRP